MLRSLTYLLFASPLLAQLVQPAPQQAPIDALIGSYQSAFRNGRYDEAAAKRDQARALLGQIPVDDPQFANWAQRVSQIYDSGGFALQARNILEQALVRAAGLPDSSPVHIALLDAIARSWEQDRNLLKAVNYLEQALAAVEAPPPSGAPTPSRVAVAAANYADLYQRLFNLYRRLGRPQDAAAVLARVTAHVQNSDRLLASIYQQQGQIDEAEAILKRQAAQASDPQQAAAPFQWLANLYQSAQRYGDAAGAWQQAIGKVEVSGSPGASVWMRQSLANMFQQAGQIQAADGVYRQLMAEQTSQQLGIVTSYANFLAQTDRVDQAEKLLNDYQASHSGGEPWVQNNLMMALSNVERIAGKSDLADEYQRRAVLSQPQPTETGPAEAMQRAIEAVNAGKVDEAFNLTLQALDSAHGVSEIESACWVALTLASRQQVKADEIHRRAITVADRWSAATVEPLLRAQQEYTRSLQNQQRWSEADQAAESYSATLTAARGAGTGWQGEVLRLRTGANPDSLIASQDLVALEESLSGSTSEPYLYATETLASAMESNDDAAGALPLRRKAVTIADLVYNANDSLRASVRINAAMAYAQQGQFDEAETLAKEAVALSDHFQPSQPGMFTGQLIQVLQMKQAAQASLAPKQ